MPQLVARPLMKMQVIPPSKGCRGMSLWLRDGAIRPMKLYQSFIPPQGETQEKLLPCRVKQIL
jgi:hypothetical protein